MNAILQKGIIFDPAQWGAKEGEQANAPLQAILDYSGSVEDHLCIDGKLKTYLLNQAIYVKKSTEIKNLILDWDGSTWTDTSPGSEYDGLIKGGSGNGNTDWVKGIILNNIQCNFTFDGDPEDNADISNPALYNSPTQLGIATAGTDGIIIKNCRIIGNATSGIGIDNSVNAVIENNLVSVSQFHGIVSQGNTAASRNTTCKNNTVVNVGQLGFDVNQVTGEYAKILGNTCTNVRGLFKVTDGKAIVSNNEVINRTDTDTGDGGVFGNSNGLVATNNVISGGAFLFSTVDGGDAYQVSGGQWISDKVSYITLLRDNVDISITDVDMQLVGADGTELITEASGQTKTGCNLTFRPSRLIYDTTDVAIPNSSSNGAIFDINQWADSRFDVSINIFKHIGQSSHRFFTPRTLVQSDGYFRLHDSNMTAVGCDEQLYIGLSNCNDTRVENNTGRGFAWTIYESSAGATSNIYQDGNYSPIASSINLGSNVRIPPAYQRRALPTATTNLDSGSVYNNGGALALVP